jgi:hypothetical protein
MLRSMILRPCVLVASLLPLLASAGECSTSALEYQRAKWAAAAIKSYRFTLWEDGGGWSEPPVRVTVSEGKVLAARYLHYASRPGAELAFDISERETADIDGRDTIPKLFGLIQQYLEQAGNVVNCTFHPELGFPMSYGYHPIGGADGDYGFGISDFELLE